MQEMWIRSLGWQDPLEEEMATYSSILSFFLYFGPNHFIFLLFFLTLQYCIGFAIYHFLFDHYLYLIKIKPIKIFHL